MQSIQCRNHPGVAAHDRCGGCAETFCHNCLVDLHGQKYCGSCKVLALKGLPMIQQATRENPMADEAFRYAFIGLIPCVGIVMGPLAILKAIRAKKEIAADPLQTGEGKANAALIIASVVVLVILLGVLSRAAR
jgi:hypothetical protein